MAETSILAPLTEPDWQHPGLAPYLATGLLKADARISDVIPHARARLAYLVSTHPGAAARNDKARLAEFIGVAARWQCEFALAGVRVVSPVLSGFETAHFGFDGDLAFDPLDPATWPAWCEPFQQAAGVIIVPPMRGIRQDRRIWAEIIRALTSNRRVFLMDPAIMGESA